MNSFWFFRAALCLIAVSLQAASASAVIHAPVPPHSFYYQVLAFSKGSSEIPDESRAGLTTLIQEIKEKKQRIEQAHVAVWSDRPFSTTASLSPKDRDLADQRIARVENELEAKYGIGNVESYNMAKRSHWFARAYGSGAKELKSLFAMPGAPRNVTPDDFQTVKTKGGPSKAIVLIEIEN